MESKEEKSASKTSTTRAFEQTSKYMQKQVGSKENWNKMHKWVDETAILANLLDTELIEILFTEFLRKVADRRDRADTGSRFPDRENAQKAMNQHLASNQPIGTARNDAANEHHRAMSRAYLRMERHRISRERIRAERRDWYREVGGFQWEFGLAHDTKENDHLEGQTNGLNHASKKEEVADVASHATDVIAWEVINEGEWVIIPTGVRKETQYCVSEAEDGLVAEEGNLSYEPNNQYGAASSSDYEYDENEEDENEENENEEEKNEDEKLEEEEETDGAAPDSDYEYDENEDEVDEYGA